MRGCMGYLGRSLRYQAAAHLRGWGHRLSRGPAGAGGDTAALGRALSAHWGMIVDAYNDADAENSRVCRYWDEQAAAYPSDAGEWCSHCFVNQVFAPHAAYLVAAQGRLAFGMGHIAGADPVSWASRSGRFSSRWDSHTADETEWRYSKNAAAGYGLAYIAHRETDALTAHKVSDFTDYLDSDAERWAPEPAVRFDPADPVPLDRCRPECACAWHEKREAEHYRLSSGLLAKAAKLMETADQAQRTNPRHAAECDLAVSHIVASARMLTYGFAQMFAPDCDEDRRFKPRVPLYEAFNGRPGIPHHDTPTDGEELPDVF